MWNIKVLYQYYSNGNFTRFSDWRPVESSRINSLSCMVSVWSGCHYYCCHPLEQLWPVQRFKFFIRSHFTVAQVSVIVLRTGSCFWCLRNTVGRAYYSFCHWAAVSERDWVGYRVMVLVTWCPSGATLLVTMRVHCHMSVPVFIWPEMLQGPTTPTTSQPTWADSVA